MGYTRTQRMQALRRQALELIGRGAAHSEIAAELGVTRAVVWKWSKQAPAGADPATTPADAPDPALAAALPAVIAGGARAYGFATDDWTNARITVMFEIEFGMRLTPIQAFHLVSSLTPVAGTTSPGPNIGSGDIAAAPGAPAPA